MKNVEPLEINPARFSVPSANAEKELALLLDELVSFSTRIAHNFNLSEPYFLRIAEELFILEKLSPTFHEVIGQLMMATQSHDIIRQRLDHISLAAQEMDREFDALTPASSEELRGELGHFILYSLQIQGKQVEALVALVAIAEKTMRGIIDVLSGTSTLGANGSPIREELGRSTDAILAQLRFKKELINESARLPELLNRFYGPLKTMIADRPFGANSLRLLNNLRRNYTMIEEHEIHDAVLVQHGGAGSDRASSVALPNVSFELL